MGGGLVQDIKEIKTDLRMNVWLQRHLYSCLQPAQRCQAEFMTEEDFIWIIKKEDHNELLDHIMESIH